MPKSNIVRVEKQDASWVIIDRQDVKNALDLKATNELSKALEEAGRDEHCKVVVLTGEGDVFCAGGDIHSMHEAKDKEDYLRRLSRSFNKAVIAMRNMTKPVVAAINGPALGAGFSLVLGTDLRIATTRSRFSMAFRNIGLAPGSGTYLLANEIGHARASRIVLFGETMDAKEALRLGLLNEVVKEGDLIKKTEKYVRKLAEGPGKALALSKDLLIRTVDDTLSSHTEREAEAIARSGSTEDGEEGMASFVEKRKPRFHGR